MHLIEPFVQGEVAGGWKMLSDRLRDRTRSTEIGPWTSFGHQLFPHHLPPVQLEKREFDYTHVDQYSNDLPDLLLTEGWNGTVLVNRHHHPHQVGVVGKQIPGYPSASLYKSASAGGEAGHAWPKPSHSTLLFLNRGLCSSSWAHREEEESRVIFIWRSLLPLITSICSNICLSSQVVRESSTSFKPMMSLSSLGTYVSLSRLSPSIALMS